MCMHACVWNSCNFLLFHMATAQRPPSSMLQVQERVSAVLQEPPSSPGAFSTQVRPTGCLCRRCCCSRCHLVLPALPMHQPPVPFLLAVYAACSWHCAAPTVRLTAVCLLLPPPGGLHGGLVAVCAGGPDAAAVGG